jgi:hypothetical protein
LQGSSTPNRSERHQLSREGELPVLRIDNVPWVRIYFMSLHIRGPDPLILISNHRRISHLPQSSLG